MRVSGLKRYAYVFLAFIQAGLTSGIIYGWPSLESIFIKEGVYRDHCHPDDPTDVACKAQENFFNMIFTVAVFVNNSASFIIGIFMDAFGPKWTNVASSGLFFIGCGLFAIPNDYAKVPAFALLGFSGPGVYYSIMHLCNLFPGHQASVLSFFSGTFSASSFIFRVFEILYRPERWRNLPSLFIEYILIIMPIFIVGMFVWPNQAFQPPGKKSIVDAEAEAEPLMSSTENVREKKQSFYNLPAKMQFRTFHYWVPVAWLALLNLAIACYLGTITGRFPTGHMAGTFNTIWSFGWVAIPFFGVMTDYFGNMFSMNVTSVGLTLFCALKLIPNTDVQYAAFVLVATVNVGMWAIFYNYLSTKFGFDNFGKLLGVSSLTVASIGALQYAFDYATNNKFHGNYLFVDIVFMCTTTISLALSIFMWYVNRVPKVTKIIEYYPSINYGETPK